MEQKNRQRNKPLEEFGEPQSSGDSSSVKGILPKKLGQGEQDSKTTPKIGLAVPKILDFEAGAVTIKKGSDNAKDAYLDFISNAVADLRKKGFGTPKNTGELKNLMERALEALDMAYTRTNEVGTITEAVLGKKYDCDTAACILADLLGQFGVKAWIALIPPKISTTAFLTKDVENLVEPGHALLKAQVPGTQQSVYMETNTIPLMASMVGMLFYDSKEKAEKMHWKIASELDAMDAPNFWMYQNRASAYEKSGDFDKALSDYKEAEKLNPDFAPLQFAFATFYVGRKNFKEALAHFDKAEHSDPENPVYNYVKMRICQQSKDAKGEDLESNKMKDKLTKILLPELEEMLEKRKKKGK